jgi:hypothetical protein
VSIATCAALSAAALVLAGCAYPSGPSALFPTATPSADQAAAHYRKVVLPDIAKLTKDQAEVVTACQDRGAITACRSAIEWELIAAEGVQRDIATDDAGLIVEGVLLTRQSTAHMKRAATLSQEAKV